MATMQGREKLLRKLAEMPAHVRRDTGPVIQQQADRITARQKEFAPSRSGALRASIKNHKGSAKPANSNVRGVGGGVAGDPELTVSLVAGDAKAWYAALVEFGTPPHLNKGRFPGTQHPGTKPVSYFFGPYRAERRRAKAAITRAMKKSMKLGK
jgi:hypothetical protein